MQTIMTEREVFTKGVIASNTFSIKANGKAFKVLIDGLYSDKIRAVIRELWSNAFDSHIAAGKADQPFDCQLPSWTDPVFRVRDYGTSLSHDGVMNLYTTVFESSKEDTNEQVGKLGLGSKSPFAYTDTFTVTAWLNGEKRIYSAYIGSDHVPQIALMSRTADSGKTGLEVSFPVKSSDYSAFVDAAGRVAIGFDVAPKISGGKIANVLDEVAEEGDGWKLWRTSDYSLRAQAKQGCVVYPLDADAIPGLTSGQRDMLRAPIFIDFPIGDLEISASRESLGYDAATCANIKRRVEEIQAEVKARFEDKINSVKTRWEAMEMVAEIQNGNYPAFVRKIVEEMTFKGKTVGRKVMLRPDAVGKGFFLATLDSWSIRNGSTQNPDKHFAASAFVEPGNCIIYLHDTQERVTYAPWRLANHFRKLGNKSQRVLYLRGRFTKRRIAQLKVRLGRPSDDLFVWLHKLPAPDMTGANGPRKPVKVKRVHSRGTSETDVDFELGGYYVPMRRDNILGDDKVGQCAQVGEYAANAVFEALKQLGYIENDATLYGIPATLIRKVKGDQWVNIFDLAQKAVSEMNQKEFLEYRQLGAYDRDMQDIASIVSQIKQHPLGSLGAATDAIRAQDENKRRTGELAHYKFYERIINQLYTYGSAAHNLTQTPAGTSAYNRALKKMSEAYPLLKFINYGHDKAVKDIAKYIDLVDAHNGYGIVPVRD